MGQELVWPCRMMMLTQMKTHLWSDSNDRATWQACECLIVIQGRGPREVMKRCLERAGGRVWVGEDFRALRPCSGAAEGGSGVPLHLCSPGLPLWGACLPPARLGSVSASFLLPCSQPSIHKIQQLQTAGKPSSRGRMVEWVLLVLESGGSFCWLNTE